MERIVALGYLRFCAGILCNFFGIPLAQFALYDCSKLTGACIKLIVNFAKLFLKILLTLDSGLGIILLVATKQNMI